MCLLGRLGCIRCLLWYDRGMNSRNVELTSDAAAYAAIGDELAQMARLNGHLRVTTVLDALGEVDAKAEVVADFTSFLWDQLAEEGNVLIDLNELAAAAYRLSEQ